MAQLYVDSAASERRRVARVREPSRELLRLGCLALSLGLVTLICPRDASAHLRLLDPLPRHPDALKLGPCGVAEDARGETVAIYEPGASVTLVWEEYVDHPGWYRVSFDEDGDDDFVDPAAPDDFDNESVG